MAWVGWIVVGWVLVLPLVIAAVYLAFYYWYISVPVLAFFGVLVIRGGPERRRRRQARSES